MTDPKPARTDAELRRTLAEFSVPSEPGKREWLGRTPSRKIRHQFQGYKNTSLTFLVVTFYELRLDGVLRSSSVTLLILCARALTALEHIHFLQTRVLCLRCVANRDRRVKAQDSHLPSS
jgi:hypothetical protein